MVYIGSQPTVKVLHDLTYLQENLSILESRMVFQTHIYTVYMRITLAICGCLLILELSGLIPKIEVLDSSEWPMEFKTWSIIRILTPKLKMEHYFLEDCLELIFLIRIP